MIFVANAIKGVSALFAGKKYARIATITTMVDVIIAYLNQKKGD